MAGRRIFWVAACAGIIVFGTLMGAMFIGQQFLQNVLDYSTLDAGLAILPAALCMVVVAPRSAKLVEARGARFTLLVGYVFCLLGFVAMLLLWKEDISYWKVGLGYALVGIGVGFAGTPASHSLTGSVPVRRAGMASGTADLQRDLGGAIMQSILGAVLTAGYAAAVRAAIAASPDQAKVTDQVQGELTKSFSSAADTAERYPQYESEIIAAAKSSFLQGDEWAYIGRHRRDPDRRRARLLHVPEDGGRRSCRRSTTPRMLRSSQSHRRRRLLALNDGYHVLDAQACHCFPGRACRRPDVRQQHRPRRFAEREGDMRARPRRHPGRPRQAGRIAARRSVPRYRPLRRGSC